MPRSTKLLPYTPLQRPHVERPGSLPPAAAAKVTPPAHVRHANPLQLATAIRSSIGATALRRLIIALGATAAAMVFWAMLWSVINILKENGGMSFWGQLHWWLVTASWSLVAGSAYSGLEGLVIERSSTRGLGFHLRQEVYAQMDFSRTDFRRSGPIQVTMPWWAELLDSKWAYVAIHVMVPAAAAFAVYLLTS